MTIACTVTITFMVTRAMTPSSGKVVTTIWLAEAAMMSFQGGMATIPLGAAMMMTTSTAAQATTSSTAKMVTTRSKAETATTISSAALAMISYSGITAMTLSAGRLVMTLFAAVPVTMRFGVMRETTESRAIRGMIISTVAQETI